MRLTPRQHARLVEAFQGSRQGDPGVSYLADQGSGMHAARAWWQTYTSLEGMGLVRHGCSTNGDLVDAFVITVAGLQWIRADRDEAWGRLVARKPWRR